MSERVQLTDVWRRMLDANVRYCTAMGLLAIDCIETLLAKVSDLPLKMPTGNTSPPAGTAPTKPSAPGVSAARASTLVLEGEAGRQALGVFLVENGLPQKVSAPVVASPFTDPEGREIHPALQFDPSIINLEPGEQILVRIVAYIDESLVPEVRYRGEASVPGLSGTHVPLVLLRRAADSSVGETKSQKAGVKSVRRATGKAGRPR
jgi:hypothetical protein